jgi:hypothetical protein
MNMSTKLMEVKQLPIIVEQLQTIESQIVDATNAILAMDCTSETYKKIKEERAKITKQYNELENGRKAIKQAILQPYAEFETVYKRCVSDRYNSFKVQVDEKINEVERSILDAKAKNATDFFNEYAAACLVDFVTFESSGIKVNLTVTEKKLKEQAKAFIDGVVNDIALINIQPSDQAAEIMLEYRKCLDVHCAIKTVATRKQELAGMQGDSAQATVAKNNGQTVEPVTADDEPLAAPVEETMHQMTFTVQGTMDQLKSLKQYIISNDIEIL